jgi:hypothetical protein
MNYRISTKLKSGTWAMPDAMAANITLPGCLFERWLKWFNPKLVSGFTMELAVLPDFYVNLSISLQQSSLLQFPL